MFVVVFGVAASYFYYLTDLRCLNLSSSFECNIKHVLIISINRLYYYLYKLQVRKDKRRYLTLDSLLAISSFASVSILGSLHIV